MTTLRHLKSENCVAILSRVFNIRIKIRKKKKNNAKY